MQFRTLTEGRPAIPCELTDIQARALEEAELAVITRSPGERQWKIAAGRKVGVVRIDDDLQLTVKPKVPIDRLLFMMGYAKDPSYWRDHVVELPREDDLASALAESFRRLALRAIEPGLFQGYRSIDEALHVLRGRVRVADQIARRRGLAIPLEVTYDEFTVDIEENRLLLAATLCLLRMPGVPPLVRRNLQRLRLQFSDVTVVDYRLSRPEWTRSRLNARYEPALRLADLILDGDSIEQRDPLKPVTLNGFVLDMWSIFEDFVTTAISHELEKIGGEGELQFPTTLDEAGRVSMIPDLVWTQGGRVQAVVDAKYKAEKNERFPNADLYQLLAYCTRLSRKHGHLVYAKGEGERRDFKIVGSPVTIHCHTLDLATEPQALLAQVRSIADRVRYPTTPAHAPAKG